MDVILRILYRFVGVLAGCFLFLISLTWRVSRRGWEENFQPHASGVFMFWHTWILTLYPLHRKLNAVILVSQSRDGEVAAGALRLFKGYEVVRGSSSRGGLEAFFTLLKLLKKKRRIGIPADGPKGPAGKVKSGGILLAKRAGVPLIPVEVKVSRLFRFSSWDRTALPLPFAKVEVIYHEPVDLRRSEEEIKKMLEEKLGRC